MREVRVQNPVPLLAGSLAAQTRALPSAVKLANHPYENTTSADAPIRIKLLALAGAHGVLLADSTTAETAPAVRAALDALGAGLNSHLDQFPGFELHGPESTPVNKDRAED